MSTPLPVTPPAQTVQPALVDRLATASDRPAIARLLATAGNFDAEEQAVGLELVDNYLVHGQDGDYPTLVAEMNGEVVGYVTVGRTPFTVGTWHLYYIASDATHRRAGIGRTLCQAARRFAEARGGQRLVLETSSRELYGGTRAFYDAVGLVEESRIADYYSPGDAVVYYVWRWSGPIATL